MDTAWKTLLRQQKGLITSAQARELGMSTSTLRRRTQGERPTWSRVLPRVYTTFPQPLTEQQKTVAALLYAGDGAALTGAAALHWQHVQYLPREVKASPVDVVLPLGRDCASTEFVRVSRTRREVNGRMVDHLSCVAPARAAADCARRLSSYETALALLTSVINGGTVTLDELAAELLAGPVRGSRLLRAVLAEAARDVRSVPEAELLRLIDASILPAPLVNELLVVGGRRFFPDFRWGKLIVEVDSRLHHLLLPGSREATQRRRDFLRGHGYFVVPLTPEQIRDDPAGSLAVVLAAYVQYAAA